MTHINAASSAASHMLKGGITALLVAMVMGCSAIPSSGPTTSEVTSKAEEGGLTRYIVRDVDANVVNILASLRPDTLAKSFGDRNPVPNQRIMVGDFINIAIWEAASGGLFSPPASGASGGSAARASLIPEQVVSRDGAVTVPYAGRVTVAGQTTQQVERSIVSKLAGKAIEPQVLVTISKSIGNTATVLGEVTNGARVPLSIRGDRILDVIAGAGGVKAPSHETFVSLQRNGRSAVVPMQRLIAAASENIFIHAGDTITLVRDPQNFSAFGATGRNAVVPFEAAGISLEQAVAKAGGLVDTRSDPHGVYLMRYEHVKIARLLDPSFVSLPGEERVPVVYRLNLRDLASYFLARDIAVRNRDMIYVANAPLTELQKVLQIFTTAAQPVAQGSSLATGLGVGF